MRENEDEEDGSNIVKGVYVDIGPTPLVELKVRFADWLDRRGW
ncbi:hypothetical protein [Halorussus ruber]|nr:hypothetical protein [Halorussus ruber]